MDSLSNFTDLVYAQSACNTPKTKENMKSHHMTCLNSFNTQYKFKMSPCGK